MTTSKHLKTAVRARMARTGERYTTARRHVVGAPPPETPPPGVVRGWPAFGGGRHHDSALLAHLLAASGVETTDGTPLDEPVVAGLAGGIGFMYFTFRYEGALPTMTIVPRIHPRPFVAGALERAGVAHRVTETGSAAKAARELDALLQDDRPAVCTVDRASLAHHTRPAEYVGAEPYDVGVVGRRDGAVLLDDECLEPVALPADAFAAARAAHRKSRHRMLVLERDQPPVDLPAAARAAIAVTRHDLVEDVMANAFAGNFGLRGLAKWADAVADRRTRTGWSRSFDSGPAFGTAMRRLHDCLTTEYSSPGAMRPLYADFLRAVQPALASSAAGEAADRYDEAGRLWAEVADAAVEGPMAPYRELAERRMSLLLDRGADAVEELREVAAAQESLVAGLDVGEEDRTAALDRIAALAGQLVPLEREACAALAEV
jgi:hypothetical protein